MTTTSKLAISLVAMAAALHADNPNHGFSANLRNCTELIGFGPVPFALARTRVPDSYTLVSFNGSAGLVLRASRCDGIGVDGSPQKAGIVAQIGIAVVPLDGTGDINNYTLLYATDHPQLALSLNLAGIPAALDLALAYEFTPDPSGHGELYTAASPSLQPAWFLTGTADTPPPGGVPVVANWWFNGWRGTVKMSTSIPSISYGNANLTAHTSKSSVLGSLIGGNTDSSFFFFSGRGAFSQGTLAVTVR